MQRSDGKVYTITDSDKKEGKYYTNLFENPYLQKL